MSKKLIIKRDGQKQEFDPKKIERAVNKAFEGRNIELEYTAKDITDKVIPALVCDEVDPDGNECYELENVQDMIVTTMKILGLKDLAERYTFFRNERTKARFRRSDLGKTVHKIGEETDRDNAN